ncbi:hypothetical protein [Pararhodobacter sp. CCB-MM2]|uniref:hypothetical protein n=1 Tax=Pararhodobacter sp. CCB-MM2 TaxID=1786003 RepID=UPI00083764F5|nr:hypothetical protein [Pararhodobacter sp. CCB-MM2]
MFRGGEGDDLDLDPRGAVVDPALGQQDLGGVAVDAVLAFEFRADDGAEAEDAGVGEVDFGGGLFDGGEQVLIGS